MTISGAGVGAIDGPIMLIPAYDPVAIALLGFGVVLAAGRLLPFDTKRMVLDSIQSPV